MTHRQTRLDPMATAAYGRGRVVLSPVECRRLRILVAKRGEKSLSLAIGVGQVTLVRAYDGLGLLPATAAKIRDYMAALEKAPPTEVDR